MIELVIGKAYIDKEAIAMKCKSKSLSGYTMRAKDGEIGEVKELYFDDKGGRFDI